MRVYKGHEVNAHSDVVLRTDHDDAMNTLAAELADFRSRLAESCGHRIVANDRIRELEGALRELRTCNEPGCKLCFACLLHIERHVTPAERDSQP